LNNLKPKGIDSKSISWRPTDRRTGDVDDLPSNISADEWGEIQKYG